MSDSNNRGEVLSKAIEIINGERQDQYGNPEDSFALIGDLWGRYLQAKGFYWKEPLKSNEMITVTAEDVAMMMVLFKIAREANQHKRDNIVDAAGYLGLYGDMVRERG